MFAKKLKIILMINYLIFFRLVFGFNGWYLPSFLRFNDGDVKDSSVEKLFLLPMDDDDSIG